MFSIISERHYNVVKINYKIIYIYIYIYILCDLFIINNITLFFGTSSIFIGYVKR